LTTPSRRAGGGRYVAGGLILLIVLAAVGGVIALRADGASLTADSSALALVNMPLGGGTIESATAVTGPHARPIPVDVRGQAIWPRILLPAGERVTVDAVVKRPGSISWIAGSSQHLQLTLVTPTARLREHYLTLGAGAPLRLSFFQPVSTVSFGSAGNMQRRVFSSPRTEVTLPRPSTAGTILIAGAPRPWETSSPALVSWFPAGAAASAVASPAPGTQIQPSTPITLTFSKPIDQALGSTRPPVSPITPGTWHTTSSHTIVFQPQGYGYGLGAKVSIGLPGGVQLVGGTGSSGAWSVPPGSTTRLQQLLALLGYLPLRFHYAGSGVALTPEAQEAAAVNPPAGTFRWRYDAVPSALKGMWQVGASGPMTRGAVMAFENDHGLTPDGDPGAATWKALIGAALAGHRSSFGYTFVAVNEAAQSLSLWHNGHDVMTTPVNTGIASAPTAKGTFPVYEHIASGTMSGTNPDGSHYNDTGIPWISYFNGGDALHGFTRAQYGSPQSLGCVEMPFSVAGKVWPYTPIGTLVNVT
jgi:L,D-transpeptidase catalytic domain/Putative peptidoglycan binding domain